MADDEVPYVPSVEEVFGETQGSAAPSRVKTINPDGDHILELHPDGEQEAAIRYKLSRMQEIEKALGRPAQSLEDARREYYEQSQRPQ